MFTTLTTMQTPEQYVKKSEYARMRGWGRSYVTELQKQGRVVLSPDGALVDWEATDKLMVKTADPSKIGVQQRWADDRAQRDGDDGPPGGAIQTESPAAPPATPVPAAADSPFHAARANREHYNGQMARLEYEWVTGLLVSLPRVEDAAHTIGRSLRDRVLGMVPGIAPELAGIGDPWELERRLTAALRIVLDDVARFSGMTMHEALNDPASGKVNELIREGRERYGTNRNSTAAP